MKKTIPALALAALLCAPPAFAAGGTNVGASASAGSDVSVVSNPSASAVSNPNQVSNQSLVSNPSSSVVSNPSSSVSGISPSANVTQNYQAADPGMGRPFAFPVQPYQASVLPYLGPWSSGYNVLEDLRSLPEIITISQAKSLYKGGVSARINKMDDNSYQFQECKILSSLPAKPLVAADGKPALDKDGKAVLVPDETKFKRVAFIFLQGDKDATTMDVIADASLEAMNHGANAIVLLKKVESTATHSSGWGIGFGGVEGQLSGAGQTNSIAASAGTGYHSATAEPVYKEGMAVLAIQTTGGMSAIQKKEAGTD